MDKDTQLHLAGSVISFVPYLLLAWAYNETLGDGSTRTFWIVVAVLLAVRAFFGVVEWLSGVAIWRIVGRKASLEAAATELTTFKFPRRESPRQDLDDYFTSIIADDKYPLETRFAASRIQAVRNILPRWGLLRALRVDSAYNEALNKHIPPFSSFPQTNDADEADEAWED